MRLFGPNVYNEETLLKAHNVRGGGVIHGWGLS